MALNKKDIYVAESLEKLNELVDKTQLLKNSTVQPKSLLKSADKLIEEARKSFSIGDEEQCFILYMRALTLFQKIRATPEFIKEKKYFSDMMKGGIDESLKKCEKLSESLEKRYTMLNDARAIDAKEKEKEMKDATANQKKLKDSTNKTIPVGLRNGTIKPPVLEAEEEKTYNISIPQMKGLMEQKSTRILIIDCRGASDFITSHINHPNCISIPQELLDPGMSANKIESKLKERNPESFHDWNKRSSFDKIVLYDWNSTYENMNPCTRTLYTAMTEWDRETTYKSPPLILKGGFRNLYYMYPHLINHPQNASVDLNKYEDANGSLTNKDAKTLDSISYPSLDDDDHQKPNNVDAKPSVSASPLMNNLSESEVETKYSGNNNSIPVPPSPSASTVSTAKFDRSKKPSASLTNVHIPVHKQNGSSSAEIAEPKVNGVVDLNNGVSKIDTKVAALNALNASKPPNIGPEVKSTQSGSPLLRPMSQDATPISYHKLKDEPSLDSPRSLLKRSHSHPNIPQSLSEDDAFNQDTSGSTQVPQFHRNLKPSTSRPSETIVPSRARQFHAVNSTEKHRTGLKNLGNTCYMNSIVQSLIHIPGLVLYFQSEKWKEHLYLHKRPNFHKSSTNGDVSLEFNAVVQEMNIGHRSIAIIDFRNVIGRHHRSFRGYEQQDSHELLTILLDWLHEELNQVAKTPLKEQKNDGLSDKEAADAAWTDYCASNKSKITELFCGQQKSAVRCLSCGKESVTFEPFFNLSVPIPISPSNRKVDIYQCLDLYSTEEALSGWNCPHCKSTVKATKKIDLWRLPPYLIIHLQRFYNDGWWKKRMTEVDFPSDSLDLTTRVKGKPLSQDIRSPRSNFQLQAVSNHYGSMDGGHYTAYCRQNSQWAKFDDSEVSQINSRDVVTPAAYILFYNNTTP